MLVTQISFIRNGSKFSFLRPFLKPLLGLAILTMITMISLTSCQKNSQPDPTPVVVSTPVQVQLLSMLKQLGLVSLNKSGILSATSIIAKGDVVEFSYHDGFANADEQLKINEDLCTKDKMVFDGTSKFLESGKIYYIRHTITPVDGTILVKKQVTVLGKPISENSGWNDNGTFKYVPKADGIAEYAVKSDGSESYLCKIVSKTTTSISRVYLAGEWDDFTNISIVLN